MFSQHITKFTGVALLAGAVAAPAAAGMPIQYAAPARTHTAPSAAPAAKPSPLAQAQALKAGSKHLLYRNVSVKQLAADLAPPPTYSRQDKQLVPSSPTPTPAPASPSVVSSSTPNGGFDWGDAAIGAGGGIVLSIVAVGGALGLQR